MAVKSRTPRLVPLLAVALGGAAVFAGTSLYVQSAPKVKPRPVAPASVEVEAKPQPGTVEVLEPSFDNKGDLVLEPRVTPLKEGADAKAAAIARYIVQVPAVPAEAKVRSVKVQGRTAVIDFSKEFDAGYGTEDERALIEGIVTTMGQFADVDQVQILIDGKPTQGIGNIDLSSPLPVVRVRRGKP